MSIIKAEKLEIEIQEQKIKLRELVNIVVKDIYEFGYIETPNNIKNNINIATIYSIYIIILYF